MEHDYSGDDYLERDMTEQLKAPYQYLVNEIIPRTPELAYEYGIVQYYGALDSQIDEYLILNLDSLEESLAIPVAELLNYAYSNSGVLVSSEVLAELAGISSMPQPFGGDPELVASTVNSLVTWTIMGYYSEWAGYGTTRLATPGQRVLEYAPVSWSQVGYPGPSLGYHGLRTYAVQ
ncbi:MAG TPA: hypothetical protein GXX75_10615 [Clostridiales bacterium]|nr:hypothetical protein [Clostridiales bacterium]